MGQGESQQINPDQVTGFDPDVDAATRPGRQRRRKNGSSVNPAVKPREFFRFADVSDHIRPIYEEAQKEARVSLDDEGLGQAVDLTKLLGELGIQRKESDGSGDLLDFPDQDVESSHSDEDEDDDRGLFHHEQKKVEATEPISVMSAEAHPISVKGDFSVGEKLRMIDKSSWAEQYPVHKVQWYLGAEIGTQVTFQTTPESEAPHYVIPASAVGKYIQVTATRRVENQIRRTYGAEVEGGIYDPHVEKAKFIETGTEQQFTDVVSVAVVGPILIPDSWSYAIVKALMEAEFQCYVKLRDEEILTAAELDGQEGRQEERGKTLQKVPAVMTITYSRIRFDYELTKRSGRKEGTSSLFSFEWLARRLFGDSSSTGAPLSQAKTATPGLVSVELKLRSTVILGMHCIVQCRPSQAHKTLILATKPRKKGFSHTKLVQDLIRVDADPSVGRDMLLYIVLGFQAATRFKQDRAEFWQQVFESGDVEKGKDLIQQYLERKQRGVV